MRAAETQISIRWLPKRSERIGRRFVEALSRRGLAALFGFVLIGCAVGPDYVKREPAVPSSWNRLDAQAGSATVAGPHGDLSQWWRAWNDPLLSEIVEQALRQNLDLRKAQAQLRQSRALRAVAGGAQYPTLEATASASRNASVFGSGAVGAGGMTTTGNGSGAAIAGNQLNAGFDASWELDVFGGVRRNVEATKADQEQAAASLDDARVSLVAEVAREYMEVRSIQLRLGIARRNLASQTETFQLTDFRWQAGLGAWQDVEQARANREQTRAQIPSLEINLAQAEHALDVLLGQAPGTLRKRLDAAGQLPETPFQVAVGIPADTVRQRPDVRAAERKLAAETARVGVAEAARYPSFSLSGSIGLDAMVQGATGNAVGGVYSLLGGITAPIFNAGQLRNKAEAQDAIREQAQAAYEQAVLTALQDVENALVALTRGRERSECLTQAVEAARNAARLAQQRYRAGQADFLSVLDAERTALSMEDNLASARADAVLALIQLYKALGGGWTPQTETRPAGKEKS